MRVSETGVAYRGGFKGSFIDVGNLIDHKVRMDILDFTSDKSCVRDCEDYCRMQIRVAGRLYVTWHSSAILTDFLKDCREKERTDGVSVFPIEDCVITLGDDRGYYLEDAPEGSAISDCDLEKIVGHSRKRR
jgi:hypothetical protein